MSPDASPMSGSTGSSAGITAAAPVAGAASFVASNVSPSIASEPGAASTGNFQTGPVPEPMAIPPSVSRVSEALTLPRASFWERMGAGFLDMIVVGILISLMPRFLYHVIDGPPLVMLVALAYFAGMWAWKGTTVGGTVLNLRVVRLDDKPVTFAVALVCGLAAVLSVMVLFLGFLWMIWDSNKQTWHDKIAGTVVVRQPKGLPLV